MSDTRLVSVKKGMAYLENYILDFQKLSGDGRTDMQLFGGYSIT